MHKSHPCKSLLFLVVKLLPVLLKIHIILFRFKSEFCTDNASILGLNQSSIKIK